MYITSRIIVEVEKRKLFSLWTQTGGSAPDKKRAILTHVLHKYGVSPDPSPELVSAVEKNVTYLCHYFHKF